jgi:hypothetical protein
MVMKVYHRKALKDLLVIYWTPINNVPGNGWSKIVICMQNTLPIGLHWRIYSMIGDSIKNV